MALERIWMPEPHVREQVPQVPCRVVVQSTGQAVLAQLRVTLREYLLAYQGADNEHRVQVNGVDVAQADFDLTAP